MEGNDHHLTSASACASSPSQRVPSSITKSFLRRTLPCPPATSFSSDSGRAIFTEALKDGTAEGFFRLCEQFRTQDEPSFCGLATLVMVLNAAGVDPQVTWKGPWRFYDEYMLGCCRSLESVKESGLAFAELLCLAECHGLLVEARSPMSPIDSGTQDEGGRGPIKTKVECGKLGHNCNDSIEVPVATSLEHFRQDVIASTRSVSFPMVIVSYSRKEFEQTGDGHYSPVGAYHKNTDQVLILDTARFKYPPHWVPLSLLYRAMSRVDKSVGRRRGWAVVTGTRGKRCTSCHGDSPRTGDENIDMRNSTLNQFLSSSAAFHS